MATTHRIAFLHGQPALFVNCEYRDGALVGGDVAAFGHAEVDKALKKLPRKAVARPLVDTGEL